MSLCEQFSANILSYMDGRLDSREMEQWKGHLDGCPDCRSRVSDFERLDSAMRTLPKKEAPAALYDGVAQGTNEHDVRKQNRRRPARVVGMSLAAMALIAVAVFAVRWGMDRWTSHLLSFVRVESGNLQLDSFHIVTTRDQWGRVLLSDGSMIDVARNTEVRISPEESVRRMRLDHGMVTCSIEKSGMPFRIVSPVGDIEVMGTVFYAKTGPMLTEKSEKVYATLVGVTSGTVRLSNTKGGKQATSSEILFVYDRSAPLKSTDSRAWRGFDMDWEAYTLHEMYQ